MTARSINQAQALALPAFIRRHEYFIRDVDGLAIVGQRLCVCPKPAGLTDSEWASDLAHADHQADRGYIYGRWFSDLCPEGEYGSAPGSCCEPLTREAFAVALEVLQEEREGL